MPSLQYAAFQDAQLTQKLDGAILVPICHYWAEKADFFFFFVFK